MIVGGDNDSPPQQSTISMGPGMGLVRGAVIDQHFAQRGGGWADWWPPVAQQPATLGTGLDEDTAVVINSKGEMRVLGSQTVTIVDSYGWSIQISPKPSPRQPLALTEIKVHILPQGYGFDLQERMPLLKDEDEAQ